MASATDPLASGAQTLEGKVSVGVVVSGVLLAALGAIEPLLETAATANPQNFWLNIAKLVVGGALAALGGWQLTSSRTQVKSGVLSLLEQGAQTVAPAIARVVLSKYLPQAVAATPITQAAHPTKEAAPMGP